MSQDRRTKILLVEDNAGDALLLGSMIDVQSGYNFVYEHVSLLDDAIIKMQASKFDVVLLDLYLPDADGTEAISEIFLQDPDIPIVAVSGIDNEALALEVMQLGVQDCLIKGEYDDAQLARTLHFAIQRKQKGEQVVHIAHHDSLTGLANRSLFYDHLEQSIAKSEKTHSTTVLLLINLDRFAHLNKKQGLSIGDEVLKKASRLLEECTHESNTISRLGSDDFAIILDDVGNLKEAVKVAENVVLKLSRRMTVQDVEKTEEVRVSASVGLAFYPLCKGIKDLMYSAEMALFRAKRAGGNRYKIFTNELVQETTWKYSLETDLDAALQMEQFHLYYQPQVDLSSGKLSGFEALLRWQHPKAGLIYPDDFIEQLETSETGWGLMEWIMVTACRQLKLWQSIGYPELKIDLNISPFQLSDPDLVFRVRRILEKTGLSPEYLEMELTERQDFPDDEISHKNIEALLDLGIKFALDDFSTGYSSENTLRHFPIKTISTIKIDRSYIEQITINPTYASCVKRDIDFAHDQGMQVVAEGVETIDQLIYVSELGADVVQGYIIGKAMTAPLITDALKKKSLNLNRLYSNKILR